MKNRPVLAYRTALHRFSLAGCPARYNRVQTNYIISSALWQGCYFCTQFSVATSQRPYERSMIYGTVKNKEARINLAIQF